MMTAVENWLQRWRRTLLRISAEPRVKLMGEAIGWAGGGFLMGAASLLSCPMPLAMGLIFAARGWRVMAAALGSMIGYRVFWGSGGAQGLCWAALAGVAALLPNRTRLEEDAPFLLPAVAGFFISATGLLFQIALGDRTPTAIYLLRIALGAAVTGLSRAVRRREPLADRLATATVVLALAQVAPVPWLGLGFLAGGLLAAGTSFPMAALAGLALDLAQVTRVPMTAALCLACLVRGIPFAARWPKYVAPVGAYWGVMALCGIWDPAPALGLLLGGSLSVILPPNGEQLHRRGETGAAQVRLELMAGVLFEIHQLLLEANPAPIDREALLLRTRERACGGCPNRKLCRDISIPAELLNRSLWDTGALGIPCKKPGRMLLELRRTQEQLRNLSADRDRRREYREATAQLYCFLGEFLREQADLLPRKGYIPRARFSVDAEARSLGREMANGDRFLKFPGTECRYYVLLCDGMGTGLGAAQEGQDAASILRQMLSSGFPAEHALRSLNSLLALRGRAGAVTVDLAEIRLDTGRVAIFKWGAAPSYLLRQGSAEKIGTAGPPPGLSINENRETVDRLSLRRGEALILFSDGVDGGSVLRKKGVSPQVPPGELAALLLEEAGEERLDDATAAVIRLVPAALAT